MTATVRELPTGFEVDGLTAHQVMAITGITYRNLDYWCVTGLISARLASRPGSGRCRTFNLDEVAIIEAAAELIGAGLTLAGAFQAAHRLHHSGYGSPVRNLAGDYAITTAP